MTTAELADYADVRERDVVAALEEMQRMGMVVLDGDVIVARNFRRRQFESDNVTSRTRAHRERSKERSNDVPGNVRRNAPDTETETDTEKDSSSEPAARADVERLCIHLADLIEANGSKRPTVGKRWRDAARLLLDLDGRTEEQAMKAIDWCQADEFWRANIQSMSKLREKYDQLRLAAQRSTPQTPKPVQLDASVQAMQALNKAGR